MDAELELLLSLDGAAYEMAPGVIVEFVARPAEANPQRPHGISYALVLRPKAGGAPWVRFDNAHAVAQRGRGRKRTVYDHWYRTTHDKGSPLRVHHSSAIARRFLAGGKTDAR